MLQKTEQYIVYNIENYQKREIVLYIFTCKQSVDPTWIYPRKNAPVIYLSIFGSINFTQYTAKEWIAPLVKNTFGYFTCDTNCSYDITSQHRFCAQSSWRRTLNCLFNENNMLGVYLIIILEDNFL